MTFFNFNVLNVNSLDWVSMNNQECKIKSEIIKFNTNEPMFYPYSITINKCKGSCNTVNDPYAKLCVPDTIKNINVKAFNLMSRNNETRHIEWHKTCKCKRRLDASACNNKQRLNEDKCRCECKELIDKGICDKGFIWNPSNCECECDKLCDVGEYSDYKNCKCRNKLVNKLLEECSENIDGNEILYNETLNIISLDVYKKVWNSCTIHMVYALAVFLFIFVDILKKIMFVLNLILVLKQQFIESNSIENINGKHQRNKH